MALVTRITAIAVLFCAWAGTRAENENCDGDYGFGAEQESQWGECWPLCDGDQQSPIDVEPSNATIEELPYLIGPFYYDRSIPFNFTLTNENYTVTLELVNGSYLYLEGGPLGGRYYLQHLQFCWGSDDTQGSDHAYNGESFPFEAQWGLYNEKYASYEEASEEPDGILRISQLYPIQESENPSVAPIVRLLDSVIEPGQNVTSDEPLTYDSIFSGYPVDDYFHYNGSFITPPCTQNVRWLVYPPFNGVSSDQVAAFRKLKSTDGPLVDNFRATQPLNGRKVVRSDKSSTCLGECETTAEPARRLSGKLRQGKKSHRHGASRRHGAAKRHGAARRHGAAKRHGTAQRRHQ